jgi:hypothetical protein
VYGNGLMFFPTYLALSRCPKTPSEIHCANTSCYHGFLYAKRNRMKVGCARVSTHEQNLALQKAADLAGRSVTLLITSVTVEQLHNPRTHRPEAKAVLDFGRSKRLPLNRTQCLALAALAGSERFADWPGLRVTLHPATAPNGKPTIRITAPVLSPAEGAPAAPAAGNGAPPAPVATATDPLPTADWDDIRPAIPAAA